MAAAVASAFELLQLNVLVPAVPLDKGCLNCSATLAARHDAFYGE
jgi:hypothetical protein